jgi:hypothetical protein
VTIINAVYCLKKKCCSNTAGTGNATGAYLAFGVSTLDVEAWSDKSLIILDLYHVKFGHETGLFIALFQFCIKSTAQYNTPKC